MVLLFSCSIPGNVASIFLSLVCLVKLVADVMFVQSEVVDDYERHLEVFQSSLRQFASDDIKLLPELKKRAKQLYHSALKVTLS
jgi:hypothetical protein